MKELLITNIYDVTSKCKKEHENYQYDKRELVTQSESGQCIVSVYEIAPGKSAYPYHYHTQNEECFYIISGSGLLKTPEGNKNITAGDFLYFPPNEKGAHKLTNTSLTEKLVYLDFDTRNPIDITFYPDSGKVGIWGKDISQIYNLRTQVDYYEGE